MPRRLGQATIAILLAVRDGARYGLDIMDRTGLPSGTVYPTLGRLEDRSYVRGRWEAASVAAGEGRPRRRYYELTPSGERSLEDALQAVRALVMRAAEPRRGEA